MAISTLSGLIGAAKQRITWFKVGSRTTVAAGWFSLLDITGNPGAGSLNPGNTAAGLVPNDSTAGFPTINTFGGGATGYLSGVEYGNSVAGRLAIYDRLYHAGQFAFTGQTNTITAPPSYSARLPNTDYKGLEIWIEVSVSFVTGNNWTVVVNYTNQDGTAGRSTQTWGGLTAANLTIGRMYPLPLQAGDTGVQSIQSVVVTNGVTAMTAGNFNVVIMRPLWSNRVQIINGGGLDGPANTGMPVLFDTSALMVLISTDSTLSGTPDLLIEVANG